MGFWRILGGEEGVWRRRRRIGVGGAFRRRAFALVLTSDSFLLKIGGLLRIALLLVILGSLVVDRMEILVTLLRNCGIGRARVA